MTPEEIWQKAQMRAAALRGQEPEQRMARDADALSGVGGSLSGLGGASVRAMSQDLVGRGDALRDVAYRRQALPKTPEELEAMRARAIKDLAVAAGYGKVKPEKDTSFGDATDLRKEVTSQPETKAFVEVESGYHNLANAPDNATGDVARIYALAKMNDPGGKVTDSDYQAAKQGQGPMARFQAYINEVEGQGFLSPQTRANMKAAAEMIYQKRRADYDSVAKRFTKITKKRGLDPEDVIIRGAPEPEMAPSAAETKVINGKTYTKKNGKWTVRE